MYKLLVIDENAGVAPLISEITGDGFRVFGADARIQAEELLFKEKPQLALVRADNDNCLHIAESLQKQDAGLHFVFMGKGIDKQAFKKFKPLDKLELPLAPDELFDRIEIAFFAAERMIDELTGFLRKPCFDIRLSRLMKKQTEGTFFCLSIDAYSFASNAANPLQQQVAAYAMKKELGNALLGINGNVILGFIASCEPREQVRQRLDALIQTMHQAADKPEVFIAAGAAESHTFNYSPEDMYLYADKGMDLSRAAGKNCVKYYK